MSDDSDIVRFAETILACKHWAERRELCRAHAQALTGEDLKAFAEQVKSRCIDGRLQTGLGDAHKLALSLNLLGKMAASAPCVALGMLARADVARQCGANKRALHLYDQAARQFLAVNDRVGWARACGGRLLAKSYAGQVTTDDLLAMEEPCQALREGGEADRLARVKNNIGLAWQQLGHIPESFSAFEDALVALVMCAQPDWLTSGANDGKERTHFTAAAPPEFINQFAMTLANKATSYLWLGQFAEAESLFADAEELFTRISNKGNVALTHMRQGNLKRQLGHVRDALRLAQAAADGLREVGLTKHQALALMYWADVLLLLHRTREADNAIQEAIDLLPAHDSPHDRLYALSLRARILASRRAYAQAVQCLSEAEQLSKMQRYSGATYHLALTQAELLLAKGEAAAAYEAALALLPHQVVTLLSPDQQLRSQTAGEYQSDRMASQSGHVGPEADSELDRANTLVVAGEAALKLNDPVSATTIARAVIQRGEMLNAPDLLYFGYRILARVARLKGAYGEALARYDDAHRALRATIDGLVYDQWAGFLHEKDVIFAEGCLTALEASDPARALAFLEMARARAVWRLQLSAGRLTRASISFVEAKSEAEETDALEGLLRSLRGRSNFLRGKLPGDVTSAPVEQEVDQLSHRILDMLSARSQRAQEREVIEGAALLQRIPHDTTAIAYALIGDELVIFVLAQQRIVAVHHNAQGAKQTRKLANELRLRIATLTQQGEQLKATLPSDTLVRWNRGWQATMGALYDLLIRPIEPHLPPDGAPLAIVPHNTLHILPLTSLFDGSRYAFERWVIRCIPSVQTLSATNLTGRAADTPARPPRLLALGHSNGGELPQTIEQATAVARIFGDTPLLEAEASSTRLREACTGRAYLHIATHGEWRENAPYAAFIQLDDGPFHPTDALLLNLRDCRLVTLAACQTGQGNLSGGDAYVGLSQVFHEAGADAVLAAFWRVEANATLEFMQRFYGAIAQGLEPYQALRATQLLALQEPSSSLLASPFGWAGFHLTEYTL